MQTIGVAIEVPSPHGAFLRAKRTEFGDTRAETIPSHITVIAPTDVAADRLDEFTQALAEVAEYFPKFPLVLRGTGTFRPVSPVVFVAVSEGIAMCEQLYKLISMVLELPPPRFSFHPHVTVAQELPDDVLDRAYDELADFKASWMVDGFTLYTFSDDTGWTKVESFELASR
jgi:2'-5' RNA ligase